MHSLELTASLIQNQTVRISHFDLISKCPGMGGVASLISKGHTTRTNLILGETGTGKEFVAHALHEKSARRHKPFVVANCAAIPENLVESLFFGHERGAFTGAYALRQGVFEQAQDGTVFLDEIGELPFHIQGRFLRILESKPFSRVGGSEEVVPKCKVIAATNRNLDAMVEEGKFRQDLLYRLNVFPITIPPLRDRKMDILHFAKYFTHQLSEAQVTLNGDCIPYLLDKKWTGNVRELENFIERTLCMLETGESEILPRHLVPCHSAQIENISIASANLHELAPVLRRILLTDFENWDAFHLAIFKEVYILLSNCHLGTWTDMFIAEKLALSVRTIRNYKKKLGL